MAITNDLREFNAWRHLIYGAYTVHEVIRAVQDKTWQSFRLSIKGQPIDVKYYEISQYVERNKSPQGGVPHDVKVQVTNYVFALKRGGLIR